MVMESHDEYHWNKFIFVTALTWFIKIINMCTSVRYFYTGNSVLMAMGVLLTDSVLHILAFTLLPEDILAWIMYVILMIEILLFLGFILATKVMAVASTDTLTIQVRAR